MNLYWKDIVAEWLRRWTWNPLGSPAQVRILPMSFFNIIPFYIKIQHFCPLYNFNIWKEDITVQKNDTPSPSQALHTTINHLRNLRICIDSWKLHYSKMIDMQISLSTAYLKCTKKTSVFWEFPFLKVSLLTRVTSSNFSESLARFKKSFWNRMPKIYQKTKLPKNNSPLLTSFTASTFQHC